MSILGNDLLLAGTDEGYNLTRSLRFRASASAYLNRTPASTSNQKTWTWSGWVKRGTLTGDQAIFFAGTAGNNNTLRFNSDNTMYVFRYDGAITWGLNTTQVFRDPSAWYHVVVAYDSTQATSTNRVKLYINGVQVTAFSSATYPSLNLNSDVNNTVDHRIANNNASNNFDGYQTEDVLVDGQALTPSSFGSTNATTGVWQPARYTGTYGTNGFYLPFTDNSALTTSSNVGLGRDFSGNGNYWTTNNISITAGVTYDSMTDVPTLTSATAANFAVLNPVALGIDATLTNGNLTIAYGSATTRTGTAASMGMTSGKYYWEITVTASSASPCNGEIGITNTVENSSVSSGIGYYVGYTANGWAYEGNAGNKVTNAAGVAYGSSYTTNDVIGVAFDATAGSLTFYKNNTSQGVAFSSLAAGTYYPAVGDGGGTGTITFAANFGQRPFTYTPPTGFVALNTFNLPTSTILQGNKVMDATLYTGTGANQNIVNAAGFKPDFVWGKVRNAADQNFLLDSVRGSNNWLVSNSTNPENTDTTTLVSFNSNGFTVGTNTNLNRSGGYNFVGWQWQAGQGTTSSNTNGTITSTVSVNASAGFSVVTATSPASGNAFTLGHGLGVAPQFIISKSRSGSGNWSMYHRSTGAGGYLLFTTAAYTANTDTWNNTTPTSSLISTTTNWWGNSANLVFYCWTPIAGFSAFGSYTGNGSTDGPMVYTGFQPKWIMIKQTSASGQDWQIQDTTREPYNDGNRTVLWADLSNAEVTDAYPLDVLSNGFKIRNSGSGNNASGATYIYAAFATSPFKNSLAF